MEKDTRRPGDKVVDKVNAQLAKAEVAYRVAFSPWTKDYKQYAQRPFRLYTTVNGYPQKTVTSYTDRDALKRGIKRLLGLDVEVAV